MACIYKTLLRCCLKNKNGSCRSCFYYSKLRKRFRCSKNPGMTAVPEPMRKQTMPRMMLSVSSSLRKKTRKPAQAWA